MSMPETWKAFLLDIHAKCQEYVTENCPYASASDDLLSWTKENRRALDGERVTLENQIGAIALSGDEERTEEFQRAVTDYFRKWIQIYKAYDGWLIDNPPAQEPPQKTLAGIGT